MNNFQTFLKGTLVFLLAAFATVLSSCTEKLSVIGSDYLHDTITSGIHVYSDSSALRFQPIFKPTVQILYGLHEAINSDAPELFFGKVDGDIEVWAAMKMPLLTSTIGNVLTDTLILRMRPPSLYHYGDPNNQVLDFAVWTEEGNAVNDSTQTLDIVKTIQVVGSFTGTLSKDSLLTVRIPLDSNYLSTRLRTASLALVIRPNPGMNTIRWFASNENGDSTYAPTLKLLTQGPTDTVSVFVHPTIDFHIVVKENTVLPPGEHLVRGSYAARERIIINIDSIRSQLKLNPFATINSGLLQVRTDPQFRTTSNVPVDTIGPSLAYLPHPTGADSGEAFVSYGTSSASDPNLYGFQIRSLIENALRTGMDSLVLELRSGFAFRAFKGSSAAVEDYDVNRWVIYGPEYGTSAADVAKRPKLILTYSYLR